MIQSTDRAEWVNDQIPFSAVETVMFDLDGTLRHNDPPGIEVFHEMVEAEGWRLEDSKRREAERWTYEYWASSDELKSDVRQAGDKREDLYRLYILRHLSLLGIPTETRPHLSRHLQHKMSRDYSPLNRVPPDVRPTLEWCRMHGFGLGLVSNRHEPLQPIVEEVGLEGIFDFTLAAGEVGWWKPDPRLLRHAVELANTRTAATVYVGDNPYADVECARKAGLHPVLIDPRGLFPQPDCLVIRTVGELRYLLYESAG